MNSSIKINNKIFEKIIFIELILVLFERFLIQNLKAPDYIIYLIDILNIFLFFGLIKNKKNIEFRGLIVLYTILLLFSSITGILNFSTWVGNLATLSIEFRNFVRFPIFFLSCALFLDSESIRKIYKIFMVFFFVNLIFIIYQYLTFHPPGVWTRGDMLNGLFGTEVGGNTFVNVSFLVVIVYALTQWSQKKFKTNRFMVLVGFTLFISAIIELKAFFVEFAMLYIWYFVANKKTYKEFLINIFLIFFIIFISFIGLQIMYKEYPWFYDSMSFQGIKDQLFGSGYTGSGDLNRFTGIFTVCSKLFDGDISKTIFGLGLGNASSKSILGSYPTFFNKFYYTHYDWFSSTYTTVQVGLFGLLIYLSTFINLLFKKKINKEYTLNSQIMCLLALFLVFYGEALKTDAGYLIYFAISSGFIKNGGNNE